MTRQSITWNKTKQDNTEHQGKTKNNAEIRREKDMYKYIVRKYVHKNLVKKFNSLYIEVTTRITK